MRLLDRLLVANDFSKSSENVLSSAIELAKIFGSIIVPIHVMPENLENEKVKTLLRETALNKLELTELQIKDEGVRVEPSILTEGVPHEAIVKAAVDTNTNLILVGSGETKKGDNFKLGTTAERIIQKSHKPVFVIKEHLLLNVHHILCPVDFSPASHRALQNAITMARRFKSELTILSVYETQFFSWFASGKDREIEYGEGLSNNKKRLDAFLQKFNLNEVTYTTEISSGNPSEEILSTLSKKMIDLLIMGTSGKTGINRMLMGSVTEKVIREVPCSFLTLKDSDAIGQELETALSDIEQLHKQAKQLFDDGHLEEAKQHYMACLNSNDMFVPAYMGLAKVYDKIGEPEMAEKHRKNVQNIMESIWYQQIEEEVRKLKKH